jgi:hypothetical protein
LIEPTASATRAKVMAAIKAKCRQASYKLFDKSRGLP